MTTAQPSRSGTRAAATPELVITRVFDAPRDLVWKAWTEADRLVEWWGPKGLAVGVRKLDPRPGGVFHYSMGVPDGRTMWGKFVYREIAKPERMAFVVSFSDETEGVTRHPLSASWPLEVLNTLILSEDGGRTVLTLKGEPVNATEDEHRTFMDNMDGVKQGFAGTYEQLDAYLAKVQAA